MTDLERLTSLATELVKSKEKVSKIEKQLEEAKAVVL